MHNYIEIAKQFTQRNKYADLAENYKINKQIQTNNSTKRNKYSEIREQLNIDRYIYRYMRNNLKGVLVSIKRGFTIQR